MNAFMVGSRAPVHPARSSVVVTDNECKELAERYLAESPERVLYSIDQLDQIDADELFVIGLPGTFSRRTLDLLLGSGRRWTVGVATGRDVDELSRFLDRQTQQPYVDATDIEARLVDEPFGRTLTFRSDVPTVEQSPYPAGELMAALSGYDVLGLHVHGEGAHGNLRHLVLCGHMGGHDPDDSCSPLFCKRAGHAEQGMASFSEIACDTMLLFTCCGFSVAREHYPSGNSVVLSLVGGDHVRTILCNDRPVPLRADEISLAFRLAVQRGPIDAERFLNDLVQDRMCGHRPWFLVGDPALATVGTDIPLVLEQPLPPGALPGGGPRVYLSNGIRGPVALTADSVLVNADEPGTLRLEDITEDLSRQRTRLREAAQLCLAVDLILDALPSAEDDHGDPMPRELRAATASLRRSLLPVNHAIWDATETGVLTSGERRLFELAGESVRTYARLAAQALIPMLDERVDDTVASIAQLTFDGQGGQCPRCDAPALRRRGAAWAYDNLLITTEECTTCGPRRATIGLDPAPTVVLDASWDGEGLPVTVQSADPDTWIGLSLKDKAKGTNLIRFGPHLGQITHSNACVAPTAQPSPDLHTLRILAVGSGGLSIDRVRVAVHARRR